MLVLLGVVYGLVLLLWLLTALPALAGLIPGELPAATVVPWLVVVLGWLSVPVTCVIALEALTGGVLDGRSLLPPLSLGVLLAGVGLGAVVDALGGVLRRARPASGGGPEPEPEPEDGAVGAADDARRVEAAAQRALAAPVVAVPPPWRAQGPFAITGLRALGFGDDPETGRELMLVVSARGRGLFDVETGTRVARDPDPRDELCRVERVQVAAGTANVEHRCRGLGPLAGRSVRAAGFGWGGLVGESARWVVDVVREGSRSRVVLGHAGGLDRADADRWVVRDVDGPLRAVGFSTGRVLVVATADTLWWATRPPVPPPGVR